MYRWERDTNGEEWEWRPDKDGGALLYHGSVYADVFYGPSGCYALGSYLMRELDVPDCVYQALPSRVADAVRYRVECRRRK